MIDTYEYIKTKMWSIIHVLNYIFTVYECNCLIVKIFFILLKTFIVPQNVLWFHCPMYSKCSARSFYRSYKTYPMKT